MKAEGFRRLGLGRKVYVTVCHIERAALGFTVTAQRLPFVRTKNLENGNRGLGHGRPMADAQGQGKGPGRAHKTYSFARRGSDGWIGDSQRRAVWGRVT